MVVKGSQKEASIYQVKVRLLGVLPPVWRRFLVDDGVSLGTLHDIIQIVMGWDGCHLHFFTIGETEYGDPRQVDDVKNENSAKLKKLITEPGMKIFYEYDFGDRWIHSIIFEKVLPPEQGMDYPVCIAGKRACPPDDCGGPWGYGHFLEAISNPEDPEHEEMLEWAGGGFDPGAFDIKRVNNALKYLK